MAKTAKNCLIQYESGASTKTELLTTADGIVYEGTDNVWSGRSGYAPSIKPDGIISGCEVTPTGVNNETKVEAGTAYLAGTIINIAADASVVVARGASAYLQTATIYSSGALSTVAGTPSASGFSDEIGAAGGPPEIPVGAILVSMTKYTSASDAPVDLSEIHQDPSTNTQERYDYPSIVAVNGLGEGNQATTAARKYAHVRFAAAQPAIHTAAARRRVYATVSAPTFAEITESDSWVPAEESSSVSSKDIYRRTLGAASTSLGAASFNQYVSDPITDPLCKLEGETLTFKVWPDENEESYWLTQGVANKKTAMPASDNITVAWTIAASGKSVGFDS